MKIASLVARILLGLLFVFGAVMFFLGKVPEQKLDPNSPIAHFMSAMGPTGYMNVVKALELVGGLLLLSGRFINLGLSLLGPVVVNIILFNTLVAQGNYGISAVVGVLTLVVLLGRKDYVKVLTTP